VGDQGFTFYPPAIGMDGNIHGTPTGRLSGREQLLLGLEPVFEIMTGLAALGLPKLPGRFGNFTMKHCPVTLYVAFLILHGCLVHERA